MVQELVDIMLTKNQLYLVKKALLNLLLGIIDSCVTSEFMYIEPIYEKVIKADLENQTFFYEQLHSQVVSTSQVTLGLPDAPGDEKFLESHQEYWQYIYDEFGVLNFLVESQEHDWINKLKNNENVQQFNDT